MGMLEELLEEVRDQRRELTELRTEVQQLKAAQPEWLREEQAQRLSGLSQSTLARERKRPGTLLVVTESPLRYLRSSVEAFVQQRLTRKNRYLQAA